MSYRDEVINKIIKIEGGYVNDPADSGGETNYGVTIAKAREYGYEGEMSELPLEIAKQIYIVEFWDRLRLNEVLELSTTVAREMVDTGINLGVKRSAIFLQRSLNVLNNRGKLYEDLVVDGHIGNKTMQALKAYFGIRGDEGRLVLFNMLNCLQGAFYVELAERREKDERFVYGWYRHRIVVSS